MSTLAPSELKTDAALSALGQHCRHVAAVACELSSRLALPAGEIDLMRVAALTHHAPTLCLPGFSWKEVIAPGKHSGNQETPSATRNRDCWREEERIVGLFQGAVRPSDVLERVRKLAAILEVANLFVEQLEWIPYERRGLDAIIRELEELAEGGMLDRDAVRALSQAPASTENFVQAAKDLPAYPTVAMRVLRLLHDDRVTCLSLDKLVSSDQVLATALLGIANSALYGAKGPITSIGRAIAHIGFDAAIKVTLASSFRPLFASRNARDLWRHSIQVAQICCRLARKIGGLDEDQALVVGLVHDIGRLVAQALPRELAGVYQRVSDAAGCPVIADIIVLGKDHGQIGADALARWGVPEQINEAVRSHHEPEMASSSLASMLYIAEFISESDEDIPSAVRLHNALDRLKISSVADLLQPGTKNELVFEALSA